MPENPQKGPAGFNFAVVAKELALAMELPFVLVGSVGAGGLVGYGVDHLLHTRPVGLLVGGGLGFAAGIRELLRRIPKSKA
jgi:F0F1-type ATP synthase assembly protein I